MPDYFYIFLTAYFTGINILAALLTLYDKNAARRGLRRIRERTLFFISIIGGSVVMLAVMRIIRHKTKHKSFMLGIPVIIFLQITAALFILLL